MDGRSTPFRWASTEDAEAILASITLTAADSIIATDADQRIVMYNHGAEKTFGWDQEAVLGQPVTVLMPERLREAYAQHVADSAASDDGSGEMGQHHYEIVGLRKNGEEFPAEVTISSVDRGGSRFLAFILRDVSEQRRRESALHKMLKQREDLLYTVAHDLRNPLQVILSDIQLLDLLTDRSGHQKTAPAVARSLRLIRQMRRLLNVVLDEARAETGKLLVNPQPISAFRLISEAVDSAKRLAEERDITVEVLIPPGLPNVLADRVRVLQVLDNLAGNAIKFTPEGGTVTFGTGERDGMVWVSVRDTGDGVPPDQVPRLFMPFWQADSADVRGVGLGLGICHRIVESHGGRIWVESVPGDGATFYFTLPIAGRAIWPLTEPA